MSDPQYTYLPWMRQGISRELPTRDDLSPAPTARAALKLVVEVEGVTPSAQVPQVSVLVYGPGDITGIDPRLVVRMEPPPGTNTFEPDNFAFIELARADLPWMFSPIAPNGQQLRPWLSLVVVEQRPGVKLSFDPVTHVLPVLEVDDASRELPDLRDCFAWAHAELTGNESLDDVLRSHPERVISRVLCARRLNRRTAYYACVVPVFEVGRRAGLGVPADHIDDLRYAWSTDPRSLMSRDVKLPVYHSWSFATGEAGSFEDLAALLRPAAVLEGVGTQDMDVSHPGGGLPPPGAGWPSAPWVVGLEGALRPLQWTRRWPPGHPTAEEYGNAIEQLLNRAQSATGTRPVLSPPIYGGGPAGEQTCRTGAPAWLRTLNRDPRYRVAAGLGSAVVHALRDQLLGAAWAQIGEVRAANQALAQAQLARANGRSIWERRVQPLDPGSLIQVTGPAHSRVRVGDRDTITGVVSASKLPDAFPSIAFRRSLSPTGVLRRRAPAGPPGAAATLPLFTRLNEGTLRAAPPPPFPSGSVNVNGVLQQFPGHARLTLNALAQAVSAAPSRAPGFPISDDPEAAAKKGEQSGASTRLFQQAVLNTLNGPLAAGAPPPPREKKLPVDAVKQALSAGLDPAQAIQQRVTSRIVTTETWSPADPLDPILAAPSIGTPMYEPLKQLSQDFLLPGLTKMPPNTVAVVKPNWPFVEAYMVGLNYEMGRELLWNEYPTDEQGTYFRQFFDPRGHVLQPASNQVRGAPEDIAPIHQWDRNRPLGDPNAHAGGDNPFVLLIRAELLRRFPNAMIYASRAVKQVDGSLGPSQAAGDELFPAFQGRLEPDVTFAGFDFLDDPRGDAAKGAPGWFFVIQQHLTEPHFGLAPSSAVAEKGELAWDAVAEDQTSAYVPVIGSLPDKTGAKYGTPPMPWGKGSDAGQIAVLTLRHPVRIAIHASQLLAEHAP